MFVKRSWYCAARSRELGRRPLGRTLLGRRVVLFRDAAGTAHALGARCPHRGADLSAGRVTDGCVECPYHGWRYDSEGRCVLVPSQPTARIPARARVPRHPLVERRGLIHLWMDPESEAQGEPPDGSFLEGYHRLAGTTLQQASYDATVEITLDAAHLPFVHRRSAGAAMLPELPHFEIGRDDDGRGFWAIARAREAAQATSPPSLLPTWLQLFTRPSAPLRELRARFDFGAVAVTATREDGSQDTAFAFITPSEAQRTWMFPGVASSPQPSWPIRLGMEWLGRRLLREDRRMLAGLLTGPGGLERPVNVESDRVGLAFRRLYADALRAEGRDPSAALPGASRTAAGDRGHGRPLRARG